MNLQLPLPFCFHMVLLLELVLLCSLGTSPVYRRWDILAECPITTLAVGI